MLALLNFVSVRFGVNAAWRLFTVGLPLLALLAGAAGGAYAAWHLGRAPLRGENADLREAHAEAARLAALAGARRLQDAQARSDTLAGELLETLADNDQLTQEKTHALQSATSGRACLSGPALRVLHGSPGITVAGVDGLPAPRPGAAAAGAAPAAHPDAGHPADSAGTGEPVRPATELAASDTAVAVWIATAGGQYEACRERLNALIAWHHKAPPPTTQEPHREPAP